MPNYAVSNPGKYHYGFSYSDPPYQNRRYIPQSEPFKNIQFKTAVLHNRRIYVGNVKVTYMDGTVESSGDTLYKSEINQFDKFTPRGKIDVAVGDGENIIKLETFADRILEFKDKTLHIINASGQDEFLEDSYKYKGIDNPQAVARTDYGIAWVNSFGCYIYDGREIHDLLEMQNKRKIKKDTWSSFITTTSMVGYNPSKRQILVVDSYNTATSDGNIFLYDIPTRSWVKGLERVDAGDKSNFIIKHTDNRATSELVYGVNNSTALDLKRWSDSPAVGVIDLRLKDEDFGHPHVRKKIHRIYVTSKGASGITISATATTSEDSSNTSLTLTNSSSLNTGGDWGKTEHKVTAGGNNVYSIQIKFAGTTASSSFAINDISVIYRPKGIK